MGREPAYDKSLSRQTLKLLETVVELSKPLNDRAGMRQGDRSVRQARKNVANERQRGPKSLA